MEREDDRHRQLIDSIGNVAQAVEDSSAFAQCKKLVERHPFLTRRTRYAGYSEMLGRSEVKRPPRAHDQSRYSIDQWQEQSTLRVSGLAQHSFHHFVV